MITATDEVWTDIQVDEALWRSSMLPEGVLQAWLARDGDEVAKGHAVAVIRIEDAQHDLISPATGLLKILTPRDAVIEPGSLVGRIISLA